MPFYRLGYQGPEKTELLPPEINKQSLPNVLDDFARACGDAHFEWGKTVLLEATDISDPLSQLNWKKFQEALINEDSLFDYPWNIFERRIQNGLMAGIIQNDKDNTIISTVNLIGKFNDSLRAVLGISDQKNAQVYETGAGWADINYRGIGLYTTLRHHLIDTADAQGCLIFSQGKGKGAANVNIKNGWTLIKWQDFPFSSTLMGWIEKDNSNLQNTFRLAAGKIITLPESGLYSGQTVSSASELHQNWVRARDWSKNHHLWVNDIDKLRTLEHNIREGLKLDPDSGVEIVNHALQYWKKSIAHALFYDRGLIGNTPIIERAWEQFNTVKLKPTETPIIS